MNVVHSKKLSFAVMLTLLLSAAWANGQDRRPDCFVVSAGIDDYPLANKLKGDVADALHTTAAFKSQEGKIYGKVFDHTLTDAQATRTAILAKMHSFAKLGQAGDHVVIFLSGHGASDKKTLGWFFLPYDYHPQNLNNTIITDNDLFAAAEANMQQGKKVLIIIDACYCGQAQVNAKQLFAKYKDPDGGGLIVMASSSAKQLSNALVAYSAFAKAYYDSIYGGADLNGDGKITLEEVRAYSHHRTYELLRMNRNNAIQDSDVAWSQSISPQMVLAFTNPQRHRANELTADDANDTVKINSHAKRIVYNMVKDTIYQIDMRSKDVDAFLRLENPDGQQVASDDSAGVAPNARIYYRASQNGEFKIVATTANDGATGEFELSIKEVVLPPLLALAPKLPQNALQFAGALTDIMPKDKVRKDSYCKTYLQRLIKDHVYQIDMKSTAFDAYLRLENANGEQVEEDDDSGDFRDARITYRATETGDFTINATTFQGGKIGEFTVTIVDLSAAAAVGAGAGAGAPQPGNGNLLKLQNGSGRVITTIGANDPRFQNKIHRAYTVNLEEGKTYQFDQMSDDIDCYLYLVGPDGDILAEDDDGGGGLDSRIVHRAARSGTYRLIATSLGGSGTGAIVLRVNKK